MKEQKHDFNVIAGALEGINSYLYNFTHSVQEDRENSLVIFEFTKQALLTNVDDITRFAMPKGLLNKYKIE